MTPNEIKTLREQGVEFDNARIMTSKTPIGMFKFVIITRDAADFSYTNAENVKQNTAMVQFARVNDSFVGNTVDLSKADGAAQIMSLHKTSQANLTNIIGTDKDSWNNAVKKNTVYECRTSQVPRDPYNDKERAELLANPAKQFYKLQFNKM